MNTKIALSKQPGRGRMLRTLIRTASACACLAFAASTVAAQTPDPASMAAMYAAAHLHQTKPALVMVGTIDEDGFPQIRAMSNMRNPVHAAAKLISSDDFAAYAITNADTEKLKHLAKNPTMSMYYQERGQGLLLMGKCEVVNADAAIRRSVWDDDLKRLGYSGPDDPKLVLLRFTPTHAKFYYQGKQNHLTLSNKAIAKVGERDAIEKTIATYIDGHRQGKSEVMKAAFHPSALVYLGPKAEPAQRLFDLADGQPPSANLTYENAAIDVFETVGMARVELFNCYGHRYTDMFTLVKMDGGWKITCKVSHRHPL